YGEGISREGGLLDVGVAVDVVTKTGAWFTFGETRLGQGREAAKDFLKSNPDISAEIDRQIRAKLNDISLPVDGIEEAKPGCGRGGHRGRRSRPRAYGGPVPVSPDRPLGRARARRTGQRRPVDANARERREPLRTDGSHGAGPGPALRHRRRVPRR